MRVGDEPVSENGDQNDLCDGDVILDVEDNKNVRIFSCTASTGRYVTVRLNATNVPLSVCEAMVFDFNKEPSTILSPVMKETTNDQGNLCPDPLAGACKTYEDEGMSPEDAAVAAFMKGPIACGKGFFCRMKADPAGITGGMTGSEGDQFTNNRNYGYW